MGVISFQPGFRFVRCVYVCLLHFRGGFVFVLSLFQWEGERAPSEHPNPTTKLGSKMGGEFTYQPKWDPKTVLKTTAARLRRLPTESASFCRQAGAKLLEEAVKSSQNSPEPQGLRARDLGGLQWPSSFFGRLNKKYQLSRKGPCNWRWTGLGECPIK